MGGSVPTLLQSDAASCIAVSERMIALGTHSGSVHILDFLGNQIKLECKEAIPTALIAIVEVKEFIAHTAAVNDLCFDIEGEYIGSCSDDGSVVINSLFTEERLKFEYHRPMKAIALDPDYVRKASRRFVTGGLAGHLYYNVKKWIGYRDQVLHSGEGPIHSVKWRNSLIAWANDAGVKVYDAANDQRLTFIERPRGSPRPELLLPHLVWQDDNLLVIGWGTSIKIVSIRNNQNRANDTYKNLQMSSLNKVDIVASFQTSYFISGIAPFGDSLVILAYVPVEEDGEKDFSSATPSRQGNAQRPEVRVVTQNNDELSTDALPIHGFEHYKAKDYSLAHSPFSGSSYSGGQWAAGNEPLYYIVSPKDVVIAKPSFSMGISPASLALPAPRSLRLQAISWDCKDVELLEPYIWEGRWPVKGDKLTQIWDARDTEDHISWLLQHGRHEKALAAVEAGQGRSELHEERLLAVPNYCEDQLHGKGGFSISLTSVSFLYWFHTYQQKIQGYATLHTRTTAKYFIITDALKEALAELYVIDGQYERRSACMPM
ncbi:hypothetical protein SASPL_155776 [Salvia splendens]|uniref:Vps41 beta-propeller domain-containing protein n=1 Tax=Salvia splendens TaxID=180675 RepID=A0A8X8VXW7_SALSN|nr:hypothetical protein SASPL_155776 [Salvia splendens]